MKIIKVIACRKCPYIEYGLQLLCRFDGNTIPIKYVFDIPSWCPLEDAPLTVPRIDSDICPNCEQPLMCGQDSLPFCFGCGYTEEEEEWQK